MNEYRLLCTEKLMHGAYLCKKDTVFKSVWRWENKCSGTPGAYRNKRCCFFGKISVKRAFTHRQLFYIVLRFYFAFQIFHMQQIIIDIDEKRYKLLLQFLKTLDYVRIVQPADAANTSVEEHMPGSQLELLNRQLSQQKRPLFQSIFDPVAWQNQARDEWS